jgi:hypothetical protein
MQFNLAYKQFVLNGQHFESSRGACQTNQEFCGLQGNHLDADSQARMKERKVKKVRMRLTGFEFVRVIPVEGHILDGVVGHPDGGSSRNE